MRLGSAVSPCPSPMLPDPSDVRYARRVRCGSGEIKRTENRRGVFCRTPSLGCDGNGFDTTFSRCPPWYSMHNSTRGWMCARSGGRSDLGEEQDSGLEGNVSVVADFRKLLRIGGGTPDFGRKGIHPPSLLTRLPGFLAIIVTHALVRSHHKIWSGGMARDGMPNSSTAQRSRVRSGCGVRRTGMCGLLHVPRETTSPLA